MIETVIGSLEEYAIMEYNYMLALLIYCADPDMHGHSDRPEFDYSVFRMICVKLWRSGGTRNE